MGYQVAKELQHIIKMLSGGRIEPIVIDGEASNYQQIAESILREGDKAKPYLLIGIDPVQHIWIDKKYAPLIIPISKGYNVVYADISEVSNLSKFLQLLTYCDLSKYENLALLREKGEESLQQVIRIIKHDAKGDKEKEEEMIRSYLSSIGVEASNIDKVLEEPLTTYKPDYYPGTFCDIQDTLLVVDWKASKKAGELKYRINEDVLHMLYEEARRGPVNLLTGGDVRKWAKIVSEVEDAHLIRFPILSKYTFEGCKVQKVIDDLPEEEFEERYGIEVEEYVRIKNEKSIRNLVILRK